MGTNSTNDASTAATPGDSHGRAECPRCAAALTIAAGSAVVTCACGFTASAEVLREAEYLRTGVPLWQARLDELDHLIRERGADAPIEALQEARQLRDGLPAWRQRLAELDAWLGASGAAPDDGAGKGAAAATQPESLAHAIYLPAEPTPARQFSIFRFVLARGAVMVIAGAAAMSFYIGRAYGPYAQLAALIAICAASGAATVFTRSRVQATSVALSAITAAAWFFAMIWFGYKLEGSDFLRMASPLSTGLALATAVVFIAAGRTLKIGLWSFTGYVSAVLTLILAAFFIALLWAHQDSVPLPFVNALITAPLSILAVMMLQRRLPIFAEQSAARTITGVIPLAVSAITAVSSVAVQTWMTEPQFATNPWRAAILIAWGAHAFAVAGVLYTADVRPLLPTSLAALVGSTLMTAGARMWDLDIAPPSQGALTALVALSIVVTAGLTWGPRQSQQGRTRLAITVVSLLMLVGFYASSANLAETSYSGAAWCADAVLLGVLFAAKGRKPQAAAAFAAALGFASGITLMPSAVAAGIFCAAIVAVTLSYPRWWATWTTPAIAAAVFALTFGRTEPLTFSVSYEDGSTAVWAAAAMLAAAVSIGVLMMRQRAVIAGIAGAASTAIGAGIVTDLWHVNGVEAATIPTGVAAFAFGFLARRLQPTLSSFVTLTPAALIAIIPSAIAALNEPAGPRLYYVVAAVVAVLTIGMVADLAGLLLPGALGTIIIAAQPLVSHSGGVAPFASLTLGGAVLIAAGWKFERLRQGGSLRQMQ